MPTDLDLRCLTPPCLRSHRSACSGREDDGQGRGAVNQAVQIERGQTKSIDRLTAKNNKVKRANAKGR